MRKHLKTHVVFALFCFLALCSLLTACGTGTPANFIQHTGKGYTIAFPLDWTPGEQAGSVPGSTILGLEGPPQGTGLSSANMTVITANHNKSDSLLIQVQAYLNGWDHVQPTHVPSTVTINGVQWVQVAGTWNGVPPTTIYVIATLFPSDSTKMILIAYNASTNTFNQVNTADFQPMLLSFQFT